MKLGKKRKSIFTITLKTNFKASIFCVLVYTFFIQFVFVWTASFILSSFFSFIAIPIWSFTHNVCSQAMKIRSLVMLVRLFFCIDCVNLKRWFGSLHLHQVLDFPTKILFIFSRVIDTDLKWNAHFNLAAPNSLSLFRNRHNLCACHQAVSLPLFFLTRLSLNLQLEDVLSLFNPAECCLLNKSYRKTENKPKFVQENPI